jgi:hypothetical protein
MSSYCTKHGRHGCWSTECQTESRTDNTGDVSVGANTGDLNIGIGGGLTIDVATGDLGVQIAPGISIDF